MRKQLNYVHFVYNMQTLLKQTNKRTKTVIGLMTVTSLKCVPVVPSFGKYIE